MAGTDERLTELFERHYDEVLAYCARRIGRSDADDAAAEVFAVAWRRIDEAQWETIRPWLYGIARRVLANRWRSLERWRRLNRRMASLAGAPPEPPEIVVVRRDEDRAMLQALSTLRESDQEVLRLTAWEQLTASQIADVIGITTAAAEKRVQRAVARLARAVQSSPTQVSMSPRAAEEGGGGR